MFLGVHNNKTSPGMSGSRVSPPDDLVSEKGATSTTSNKAQCFAKCERKLFPLKGGNNKPHQVQVVMYNPNVNK